MKKMLIILILSSFAFAEVSWFGYYEGEADYMKIKENNIYLGYNKFRLDFDTYPSDNIRIGGNVTYKHYNGRTSFNFMDYMDKSYYPLIGGETLTEYLFEFPDTLYIDNIFLELHHPWFDLILGRQQLPSGVGYAWNPTDLFNQKDIMDPTYEDAGVDAIQLKFPIGPLFAFKGIIQPVDKWKNSTQYYQLKAWLGSFDVSVLYGQEIYLKPKENVRTQCRRRFIWGWDTNRDRSKQY